MRQALHRSIVACVILALSLAARPAAEAAAPRIIIVTGPALPQAVVIDDWDETSRIVSGDARTEVAVDAVEGRPFFDLWLFWGPEWDRYVDAGEPLDALNPDRANQHARFFPAVGAAEALMVYDHIPGPGWRVRGMTPDGLAALVGRGVPTRLDAANATPAVPAGGTPVACPVTEPAVADPDEPTQPAGMSRDPVGVGGWFISADGKLWAPADPGWRVGGVKVLWIKPIGSTLEVTGRRLDGEAPPLHASIPDGYFGDYQASGVFFPTGGCWEIEARADGSAVRFVVYVQPAPPDDAPPSCADLPTLIAASDAVLIGRVEGRGPEGSGWVWQSVAVVQVVHGPEVGDSIELLQDQQAEPVLEAGRSYLFAIRGDPWRVVCPTQSLAEVQTEHDPPRVVPLVQAPDGAAVWPTGELTVVLAAIEELSSAATPQPRP